jgi:glutamate synthase domain-containing protein 3
MTGGRVIVLGRTGRNFAAGMSGGVAYVFDGDGTFARRCNRDMVELERLDQADDIELVRRMLGSHVRYTSSHLAAQLLAEWTTARVQFIRVMPRDYKRVLLAEAAARVEGQQKAGELARAVNG